MAVCSLRFLSRLDQGFPSPSHQVLNTGTPEGSWRPLASTISALGSVSLLTRPLRDWSRLSLPMALDLDEVTLVDEAVVHLLQACEAAGCTIFHVLPHIRE